MSLAPPEDHVVVDRRGRRWTVAELRERVRVVEPGIVCIREIPDSTGEAFTVLAKIGAELGQEFDDFVTIIDLEDATARPDPAMVKAIVDAETYLGTYTVAIRPVSKVIRAILRFVTARVNTSFRHVMVDDYDEALARARKLVADLAAKKA